MWLDTPSLDPRRNFLNARCVLKTKRRSELNCGTGPDRQVSPTPRLVSTWGRHRVETTILKGVKKERDKLGFCVHLEVIVPGV